jgi:hypothetical protein
MANTDLTNFDFAAEGYRLSYYEGDLVVVNDPMLGPEFTAPKTYVMLDDGVRTWMLPHAFVAKGVCDQDGQYVKTGRDQALDMIAKIIRKGRVNLMNWSTFHYSMVPSSLDELITD